MAILDPDEGSIVVFLFSISAITPEAS